MDEEKNGTVGPEHKSVGLDRQVDKLAARCQGGPARRRKARRSTSARSNREAAYAYHFRSHLCASYRGVSVHRAIHHNVIGGLYGLALLLRVFPHDSNGRSHAQ